MREMEQWSWSSRAASSATPFADKAWDTRLPRLPATWATASRRPTVLTPWPARCGTTLRPCGTQFSARGIAPPAATESDWQDLFAYFYSLQFSEPPGEVGRGKQVLESKRCTDCHSLSNAPTGRGPSVPDWAHMDDPVVLVYQLWNHASSMKNAFARNKIEWKTLSGRDLVDLTAYVQSVQNLVPNRQFSLPAPESGKPLFDANCGLCHRDSLSLAMNLRNKTWMDIGAGIWNHSQKMPTVRMVSPDDMRKLLAYVWQLQYDGPPGKPRARPESVRRQRDASSATRVQSATSNLSRLFPSWQPRGARHGQRITGCWKREFPGRTFLQPTSPTWWPT